VIGGAIGGNSACKHAERPAPSDSDSELKTPSKVAKMSQTSCEPQTSKTPVQSEEALAKKLASAKKKAEEAQSKPQTQQGEQKEWKDWVVNNHTDERLLFGQLGVERRSSP
jgi:hypothetical protein